MSDALAHSVEGPGCMGDFARPRLTESSPWPVRIERIGGSGKCIQRPYCLPDGEPSAQDEQYHLQDEDVRQPVCNRHDASRRDIDRQRTSVTKCQMDLKPHYITG